MRYLFYLIVLPFMLHAQQCEVPKQIAPLPQSIDLKTLGSVKDVKRNWKALQKLCVYRVSFQEGNYDWKMLLVTHPKHSHGIFWFLPHDDEDTAFDAALYATQRYGGGFLAVMTGDKRFFKDQDPNRNFGETAGTAKQCREQKSPAPIYSRNVFKIINAFRDRHMPYLALHNNKNGWYGNGGSGTISILKSSKIAQSYPATKKVLPGSKGFKDEDSLVYIAGKRSKPDMKTIKQLHQLGIHVKYEVVTPKTNDCSMSNYVVLHKGTTEYYNIETEHGELETQKQMIDRIVKLLK